MSTQKNSSNNSFVNENKILVFGIIIFIVGVSFYIVSWNYLEKMYMCENNNSQRFLPNTVITIKCEVVVDVGQDLHFRSVFYSHDGVEIIKIPARLELKDPDDKILHEIDFDDKLVISIKPEKFGIYTATITSLEDEDNRIHKGSPQIWYALGFLIGYDDVPNPLGNAFVWMSPLGDLTLAIGIVIMTYGGIKAFRKK